jgi:hypothetical protein
MKPTVRFIDPSLRRTLFAGALTRCIKWSGTLIYRASARDSQGHSHAVPTRQARSSIATAHVILRGHSQAVPNRQAHSSIAAAHVICGDTHKLYQTVRRAHHRGSARDLRGHSPAIPNRQARSSIAAAHGICGGTHLLYQTVRRAHPSRQRTGFAGN